MFTDQWADIGSAASLDEVVEFYNARFNLGLTAQQHGDLVAFLRSPAEATGPLWLTPLMSGSAALDPPARHVLLGMVPTYGSLAGGPQHTGNAATLPDHIVDQSHAGRPWAPSLEVTEVRAEHTQRQLAGRMVVVKDRHDAAPPRRLLPNAPASPTG